MHKGDSLNLKGYVKFELFDEKTGALLKTITKNNLVTNLGKGFFVNKIENAAEYVNTRILRMAIGEGTTAATIDDIALEDELIRKVIGLNLPAINRLVYIAEFNADEGLGDISEAGLFTNAVVPELVCRMVLDTPFVKGNEVLKITWRIQFG